MKLSQILFHRRFSVNLYRSLRLPLGEMSFYKNWAHDNRGDPYPCLSRRGDLCEQVGNGEYTVTCGEQSEGGEVCRLIGSFFPWATYEMTLSALSSHAEVGLWLRGEIGELIVLVTRGGVSLLCEEKQAFFEVEVQENATFALTFRTGGVSGYLDGKRLFDLSLHLLDRYRQEAVFCNATVALQLRLQQADDRVCFTSVQQYLCGGISHADIKPVRYEDGTPIMENGRLFLTVSSRTEEQMYQSVLSWNPTLCDFRMEGAVFFDCGDGLWCSDVASSLIYDRTSGRWLVWMAAFSHGHVLGRGDCGGDPRFGIHLVNVTLMESKEDADLTAFAAFSGDEDPDLILLDGKWHLAICRLEKGTGYHYCHFVSDDPLDGFQFVDRTPTGEKTGGLFVRAEDGCFLVCGSDFGSRARYDVYPINDFSSFENLKCDYDDGGFRGWGSVMLLPLCGRKKYVWLTFDRHNGSHYNWSYGNIYVFDSEPIKRKTETEFLCNTN